MGVFAGPEVAEDGLVLCLDAANSKSYPGSGTTWTDLSGNGNNGTLTNGPTFNSANGGSIVFDGVNDDITITSYQLSTSDSSAPYTLSAWINRTGTTTGGGIITQYSGNFADRFGFRERNSKLSWWKGGSDLAISTDNIPTNVWKYVVGVKRTDNSVSIYIDGTEVGTGTDNLDFENVTLKIGRFGSSTAFSGNIAQVSIYNRALTAAEIQQNFIATRSRFGI
jgi:hypothetical protein